MKSYRSFLWGWSGFAVKTAFIGHSLTRRFRWRNIGILAERIVCTSLADLRRYRIARETSLPLPMRQQKIVESVLAPSFIERLVKLRYFKSPLALRTGIWSRNPVETSLQTAKRRSRKSSIAMP
jgi:hypothetical protein